MDITIIPYLFFIKRRGCFALCRLPKERLQARLKSLGNEPPVEQAPDSSLHPFNIMAVPLA